MPSMSEFPPLAPIPSGVADYFWADAAQREHLRATLLTSFRQWGYADVLPPAFEYAETFDRRANPELREELYRFVDRDGSLLALRADMTIPVARLVATRLHDAPMPQRYCYAGSIYRYGDTRAGQQREFWQAGVELVGAAEPTADAEILALTVNALRGVGLFDVRLAVGHLGFFDALIADLALTEAARTALLDAVDRNSEAALVTFLQGTNLSEPQRAAVSALPSLRGERQGQILEHAAAFCLDDAMRAALGNLRELLAAYACHGEGAIPGSRTLYVDLTEIHNLGYYTGLTFEALSPGLGYAVASGGRYDTLLGTFGQDRPAVGVAINLDRVLYVKQAAGERAAAGPLPPDILMGGRADRSLYRAAARLRAIDPSLRVAVDLCARPSRGEFEAFAAEVAAEVALWFDGESFFACRGSAIATPFEPVSLADVEEIMRVRAAQATSGSGSRQAEGVRP